MLLNDVLNISEAYKAPDKIMSLILSDDAENFIRQVKANGISGIRDMFQEEQGDRKRLKQDFSPDCVCRIVAGLVKPGNCLDMCSGTGALGKEVAIKNQIQIDARELSERAISFALLDSCIDGLQGLISHADCLRDQVFKTYQLKKKGDISIPQIVPTRNTQMYDNVIMNPPYSMRFDDSKEYPISGFMIPKSKADYGFILRGMQYLNDGGRLIAVVPHGVLFRGQTEGKIREHLISNHMINAVIGLPEKLFMNTDIPVCLLVLEKDSPNILFVDASKEFEKDGRQNKMTDQQVSKTLNLYHNRRDVDHLSHVATYKEIKGNGYNLNIPRYVDTFIPEPLPDMDALLSELQEIEREERETRRKLYSMLKDVTAGSNDMEIVERHRDLLMLESSEFRQIGMDEIYGYDVQT